ncbi:MAG: IMP dehydrogenase [Candidatus Kerfeldbacteria bacterium]
MKNIPYALAYDDVLLVPQESKILPAEVDLSTKLGKMKLDLPFISAPMDTVTEGSMAIAMAELGGLGIIHKNLTPGQQAAEVERTAIKKLRVGAAVSVSDEEFKRAVKCVKAGATLLVVDSAHGHSKGVLDQVKRLKREFKNSITIVGGNVATAEGTRALISAGADVVKVGVGPGSICTTRVVAGIGVPQLTAVMDCVAAAKKSGTPIIADGGIKYSGDIVKALAAGASAIMAGGLFAGCKEAPGKLVKIKGQQMKMYRGMGSVDAMEQGSKDRYGQKDTKQKKKLVPEGVVGYRPYKGELEGVVYQLAGGVRAGMGYIGAKNIGELQKRAQFIQITAAGLVESHPHDLSNIQGSPNY